MQSSTSDFKTLVVLSHLVSLKDIIASGFRCPQLVAMTLDKAPREQRQAAIEMDRQVRALLASCDKIQLRSSDAAAASGGGGFASPSGSRGGGGDELVMDIGPLLSPPAKVGGAAVQGSVMSPSPAREYESADNNPDNYRASQRLPKDSTSPLDPISTAQQFRQAFLGCPDVPQPIGYERIPRPPTTGLAHGNEAPMKALLLQHKTLLDGLVNLLEGEMHEALSFINMLWVQHHPADFEAQATEAARVRFVLSTSSNRAGGFNASNASSSGDAGRNTHNSVSPASSSRAAFASPMENTMRQLLLLNLKLKFPKGDDWAPLLRIRDETMSTLRSYRQELDTAVHTINISVGCFVSVVKLYNAIDSVMSSLAHINIYATPSDIQTILLDRCTNALVEAQIVMHDHGDVSRNKRLNRAVEETADNCIALMKHALNDLEVTFADSEQTA